MNGKEARDTERETTEKRPELSVGSDIDFERIVLVQCTASKRDGKHPARDLYDESDYFVKQRRYAESVADRWFIQSAKYALVEPDEEIESYDLRASELSRPDAWAGNIANELDEKVGTPALIEILGGADYADPLTPMLEYRGYDVLEPLRGQRIGRRMRTLDGMVTKDLEGFA